MCGWLRTLNSVTARAHNLLRAWLFCAAFVTGKSAFPIAHDDLISESTFIYRSGDPFPWKILLEKNIQLQNPAESIVVVYNHGSATDDNSEPYCNFRSRLFPLSDLAGRRVGKLEIFVYVVCTNKTKGDFNNPEERDFPAAYACNYSGNTDCKPAKYREFKRREQILGVIDSFASQGVPARQIFVAGHSCGGWQSLMLMAQHPEKLGGAIAYDPGCYGSPAWQAKKPNYRRLMQNEMGVMRAAKTLAALIFSNKSSSCCFPATLAWLKAIRETQLVVTPGKNGGSFTVNGEICYMVNQSGKKTARINEGHRLNYSPCFMHYTDEILRFIAERTLK